MICNVEIAMERKYDSLNMTTYLSTALNFSMEKYELGLWPRLIKSLDYGTPLDPRNSLI